ncbi:MULTISPECIES: hypothetical protein [unclassified Cryobacterium]|uniref:hypothetical protein n=1 Tax=unclassified Cryobacterium TaxID=2649013 RepID=UPI00106D06AA|nr:MULTISPECIES: hypothetical protein [unclassified Cryobacterium]TFB96519.1 hypothetical protein E3O39_10630 [Cryobacterium sp. MDB2-A-1]TFC12804.1 hypothetical protein E3O35_07795 [Cryobacterium sp. MDB2-A-2]
MRTIDDVEAYARAHPTNASVNNGSWHNWCEAFVYRAGGFTRSFDTATLAGDASGDMSQGPAPRGALHWWGTGEGHVGFELGGGLILMASNGATTWWGNAMGTATLAEYHAAKPTPTYRGWTLLHGTETLAAPSFAALAVTPIATIPPTPKDDDVTVYLKPTDNSSPLADGISRIWTDYRTIAGIDYADVWGVDGNGTARRLTAVQWRILNALPKEAITLNVVELTGNELEQIVYAPSF